VTPFELMEKLHRSWN